MFQVMGQKILGWVGKHFFFLEKNNNFMHF